MAYIYRQRWTRRLKDGTVSRGQSSKWYIRYVDADRVERTVPGFRDKRATEQRAAELERKAERVASGLLDRFVDHRRRPLREHVADWRAKLSAGGVTPKQATLLHTRVLRALSSSGAVFLSDVSASALQIAIAGWKTSRNKSRRHGTPVSRQTILHALSACKQFFAWMVRDRRAPENPLASVELGSAHAERTFERAVLSADEARRLVEAAAGGATWRGIGGETRALIYLLALETGLRAGELRSLTRGSFRLDGTNPAVIIQARDAKNRKMDELPLRGELAQRVQALLDAGATSLGVPPSDTTAEMLRHDLAVARRAWLDEAADDAERARREREPLLLDRRGRARIDFHALRHTFVSNLAAVGVHPKDAQRLARHSSIDLTMRFYTHRGADDGRAAVERLPRIHRGLHRDAQTEPMPMKINDPSAVPTDANRREDEARKSWETNENERQPIRTSIEDAKPPAGLEPATCGLQNRSTDSQSIVGITVYIDDAARLPPGLHHLAQGQRTPTIISTSELTPAELAEIERILARVAAKRVAPVHVTGM